MKRKESEKENQKETRQKQSTQIKIKFHIYNNKKLSPLFTVVT
jgi:hypothetical protein